MREKLSPRVVVAVVYVSGLFMTTMDITIVNVALPTIGRDLHSHQLDQVSVAFLVALAIFIPASGWIGDRFGNQRVLLVALALFTVASVLCGLATHFDELVAFRFLQGIGGGLLTPVGTTMLFRTFPPAERVKASSILVIPTTVAPAIGPLLGGVLVLHASWTWVFLVNLPVGAAALIFGLLFLREPPGRSLRRRFDLPGFLLAAPGLALLLYGVSEGPATGWTSPSAAIPVAVGVVLLVGMVAVELRTEHPLVSLRLLREPLFGTSSTIITVFGAVLFGSTYALTLYLQQGLDLNSQQTGLVTFTQSLGVLAGSQMASRRLYRTLGPRRLTTLALIGFTLLVASLALVEPGANLWWLRLQLFALGASVGNVFVPIQATAFARITGPEAGQASSLFNAVRQAGGAIGVALISTVITEIGPFTGPTGTGAVHANAFRWAFLVAAALVAVAIPVALRLRDDLAANTRGHHGSNSADGPLADRSDPPSSPASLQSSAQPSTEANTARHGAPGPSEVATMIGPRSR